MPAYPMALPPASVHIALLDDHALFRQGMRYILQSLPYVATVSDAAEMADLLGVCRQRLPDVLLLDLQMPIVDGPEATRQLLQEFPTLKIIVVSMFSADTFVTQMMRLGVRSYLAKDASSAQLILAIEDVLLTGYHYTPQVSRALVQEVQQPTRQKTLLLPGQLQFTPREREVLQLICGGHTATAIGERLFISRRTVEGHWQKLLEKTGAGKVAGLVAFAAKHGLLNDQE